MKILLLVHHFPPDVNSTGHLMSQVAEGLVARNHEVSVITTFPHYAEFRTWPEYRGRIRQRERAHGMSVQRVYSYAPGRKSMRNRLLNYLSFNVMAALSGVLERRTWDVILCTNGSFFTGFSAATIGHGSVPFIYNLQDLYPHVPIQAGQLKNRGAIRALRWMERAMYGMASHISVITPSFRTYLTREQHLSAQKISVIPNFVDTDFIRPLPRRNDWSSKFGLDQKFVVAHAGAIGYVYDLPTLLEVARRFRKLRDVTFLLVGDGVAKAELVAHAQELGLDNVLFLPYQTKAELPWLRASTDVALSLYKSDAARYSMPSKVYEIMASGRAVLVSAESGSDVRSVVESSGCGLCIHPSAADELEDAVLRLYRDPEARAEMGAQGRATAERSYAKPVVVEAYHSLLSDVAANRAISPSSPVQVRHGEAREAQ